MDQRSQFLYFICKVCQRVFKDKLELYVHQSNDHHQIQYTDDVNYDNRTSTSVTEVKRPANNFVHHNQQAASWFPPATGHVPNHVENQNYYTNPLEYYVVVPNQNQNNNGTTMLATATVTTNPTMNITVPIVNQQIAHSSSTSSAAAAAAINLIYSSAGGQVNTNSRKVESVSDYDGNNYHYGSLDQRSSQTGRLPARYGHQDIKNEQHQQHHQHQQQQPSLISHGNNLVTLRNEIGNEWNKVGGDSSESEAKDDVDYYCWKCKVKFGNATAYISHSSSCLTPVHAVVQEGYESQSPGESDTQQQVGRGKRGKKSKLTMQQEQNEAKRRKQFQVGQYHLVDLDEEERQVQAAAAAVTTGVGRGRRKTPNSSSSSSVSFKVENNLVANGSIPTGSGVDNRPGVVKLENKPTGREDRSFPCTHCGLKLTSNERLTTHLLQCKSRKNPYESYQYKCIKCKESFDIYLQYKRHIAIHTGEFRYS